MRLSLVPVWRTSVDVLARSIAVFDEPSYFLKGCDQHFCFASNCLFRALGDQLEGHSRNHLQHRQETVDYMIKQREDFEPFVEDDIPFEKHGRFPWDTGSSRSKTLVTKSISIPALPARGWLHKLWHVFNKYYSSAL